MKTILTIAGTRPEVIKAAPALQELGRPAERFWSLLCVTAQHREMLNQALAAFALRPDFDLDVMTSDQTLASLTARPVDRLGSLFNVEKPDLVLVQGDTTSSMTGALAAYYHQIPVGHIETGLRTDDKFAPFPEEINRRLIAQLADLHFAPTERARTVLLREGMAPRLIHVTDNTVIDAACSGAGSAKRGKHRQS